MDFQKFEISNIVKGSGRGVMYCTTIPEHPFAYSPKDRKKKYIEVHRVVMENHLMRFLNTSMGEEVHHKDLNPSNNDLSNLELTTASEHQRHHAALKRFWEKSPRTKKGQIRKIS